MKPITLFPQDTVFWYLDKMDIKPLTDDITTDVVVIGGGMAGLTAAQSFHEKGLKVVLLEKNFCGSGASGKSSGFITPDSELPLRDLIEMYGETRAKELWEFITSGVTHIKNNIEKFNIDCDYQKQDTLVVANTQSTFNSMIEKEHAGRTQLGFQSTLLDDKHLAQTLGTNQYKGGVTYGETFGIQGYEYCQGMKKVLQELGVQIYEETPVVEIQDQLVTTPKAIVRARYIIVCSDYFTTQLGLLTDKIYHAQTFLMVSAPLQEAQIKKIFPDKKYLVWDTDLVYHYYRMTRDNRLLLGGASLLYTYAKEEKHNNKRMIKKLNNYFTTKFPQAKVQFEYIWPGLIGISKDLFPLAGFDQKIPSVYYIAAAAGLPWAAALGKYSAERILDNKVCFDDLLSPYRSFPIGATTQAILGKQLSFAISNFLTVKSM